MAIITSNEYDHIDIVNGSNTNRHYIRDTTARSRTETLRSATGTNGELILTDALDEPAKKLTIHMEPKQDLHGYDKPWVGGTGKNLCPVDSITGKDAITDVDCNIPAGTYIISFNKRDDHTLTFRFYFVKGDNANSIVIEADLGCQFTLERDVVSLNVIISPVDSDTATIDDIQIEAGSTITSYEPYENICPIEGFDTVQAHSVGSNLFDYTTFKTSSSVVLINNGVKITGNTAYPNAISPTPLMLKKGQPYTVSCHIKAIAADAAWRPRITFRRATDKVIIVSASLPSSASEGDVYFTYTPAEDMSAYVSPVVGGPSPASSVDVEVTNIQMEYGSSATSYTSFQEHDISRSFASTVYGGTLTINEDGSGVLTLRKRLVTSDSLAEGAITSISTIGDTTSFWLYLSADIDVTVWIQSNSLSLADNVTRPPASMMRVNAAYPRSVHVCLPTRIVGTTKAEIYEYLQTGALQFAVARINPPSYALTSDQLQTFSGKNHIWTDGTNIELDYHGARYCTYEQVMELIANALRA